MNNTGKLLAALTAVSMLMTVSCSSKDSSSGSPSSAEEVTGDLPAATAPPEDVRLERTSKGTDPDMTITWLSDYDLNPGVGSERSTALAIFEDYYGGQINYVHADAKDKFSTLAEMINSGDEVDMFPYEPEALPNGVLRELYASLDPYFESLEADTELWADMRDIIDMFEYNGQHYVMPYSVSEPVLITYSRKMMQEEGLDDPYELYTAGKWDWDSFMDMMTKFKENTPYGLTRYGINGDFGQALLYSTGRTVINAENGRLVNNVKDPQLEKAELLMQEIAQKQLYRSDWVGHFPEDRSTLFFAMGDWSVGVSNAYNQDMDIMAVPFPKSPDADKYYTGCNFNARMLVKNSGHGQAVANYIKCERLAVTEPSLREAAAAMALTKEQYDRMQSYLSETQPVFDLGYGMGDLMSGRGDYTPETRSVMDKLTKAFLEGSPDAESWEQLRDSLSGIIDKEIQKFNN